jgi:F0F1-type ATP synthase membrane subunit b/b'
MSAFLDLDKFRKSGLLSKGATGGVDMSSYQDPTYLSFTLLFDTSHNSPLFNGEAEGFIKKHLSGNSGGGLNVSKYEHKLSSLLAFKEALFKINSEMPWHWQSLGGVDRLTQFTPENAFFGGDDAKLVIGCLETINLNIAGLMQLYRKAVWDETRWSYVLPPNLRKFSMYIYVSDIRGVYDNSTEGVISGESNRPFFMYELRYCEFNLADSGNKSFGDLSASAPEVASNEITINYQRVYNVDARALNGAVFMSSDIQKGNPTAYKNIIAPTTEIETLLDEGERNIDDPDAGIDKATADKIAEIGRNTDPAAERKLSFSQNAKKGFKNLKAKAKEQAKGYGKRATEDLKRMAKSKMEEAEIEAKRYVNRRIPNLENIYGKTMRALDAATNVRGIASGIESVVGKNVHFLDGTPLVDVLNKANRDALINIGNVYKR